MTPPHSPCMPPLSVVVLMWCWDCCCCWWWWLAEEPLLWLLGLLGPGVAIVECLNSISGAGLQCRYGGGGGGVGGGGGEQLQPFLPNTASRSAQLATPGRKTKRTWVLERLLRRTQARWESCGKKKRCLEFGAALSDTWLLRVTKQTPS